MYVSSERMHDGEGLLGIPWLGPLIFQIRKRGPAWSLSASALAATWTPGAREGSGRVPVPHGGDARLQAPESLWASRIVRVRADNARRAADRRVRSSCAGGGYM